MTAEQSMPGIIAGKIGRGEERGEGEGGGEGKGEERGEKGGEGRGEKGGEGGGEGGVESPLEVGISLPVSSSSPSCFLFSPPFSLSLLPVIHLLCFLFFNLLCSAPL